MNIIKVCFLKGGQPAGKSYLYISEINDLKVGDIVVIRGTTKGQVTEVDIPLESAEGIKNIQKIVGRAPVEDLEEKEYGGN